MNQEIFNLFTKNKENMELLHYVLNKNFISNIEDFIIEDFRSKMLDKFDALIKNKTYSFSEVSSDKKKPISFNFYHNKLGENLIFKMNFNPNRKLEVGLLHKNINLVNDESELTIEKLKTLFTNKGYKIGNKNPWIFYKHGEYSKSLESRTLLIGASYRDESDNDFYSSMLEHSEKHLTEFEEIINSI